MGNPLPGMCPSAFQIRVHMGVSGGPHPRRWDHAWEVAGSPTSTGVRKSKFSTGWNV